MIPEGQGENTTDWQLLLPYPFHFWNSLLWILPFLLLVKLFRCDLFLGNEVAESFAQPLLAGCPKQQRPMSRNDILHCVPQYLHCVPQSPLRFARPSWHHPGKDNIWCICCITWSPFSIFFFNNNIRGVTEKRFALKFIEVKVRAAVCKPILSEPARIPHLRIDQRYLGTNGNGSPYSHLNEF